MSFFSWSSPVPEHFARYSNSRAIITLHWLHLCLLSSWCTMMYNVYEQTQIQIQIYWWDWLELHCSLANLFDYLGFLLCSRSPFSLFYITRSSCHLGSPLLKFWGPRFGKRVTEVREALPDSLVLSGVVILLGCTTFRHCTAEGQRRCLTHWN